MKGVSPGAALIFLMAGPATNVATLAVVRKVLGTRTTVLYLLSITLGAIAFALIIDFALPQEWFAMKITSITDSAHCDGGASWWHTASSILFIVLIVNAYLLKFFKGSSHTHNFETETLSSTANFKVTGMRCNHCKANVERAILSLEGVTSVTIELSDGSVVVEGNVSPEAVCSAVKELGFEVMSVEL